MARKREPIDDLTGARVDAATDQVGYKRCTQGRRRSTDSRRPDEAGGRNSDLIKKRTVDRLRVCRRRAPLLEFDIDNSRENGPQWPKEGVEMPMFAYISV
jgi:hypothetical protein